MSRWGGARIPMGRAMSPAPCSTAEKEQKVRALLLQELRLGEVTKPGGKSFRHYAPRYSSSRLLAEQLQAALPMHAQRNATDPRSAAVVKPPPVGTGAEPAPPADAKLRDAHAAVPQFPLRVKRMRQKQMTRELAPPVANALLKPQVPLRHTETPQDVKPVRVRAKSPQHGHHPSLATEPPSAASFCIRAEEPTLVSLRQNMASPEGSPREDRPGSRKQPDGHSSPSSQPPSPNFSMRLRSKSGQHLADQPTMGKTMSRRMSTHRRGIPITGSRPVEEKASDNAGQSVDAAFNGFDLDGEVSTAFQQTAELSVRTEQRRMTQESRDDWVTLFQRLSNDHEVHRDILGRALELGGLPCPVQDWIDDVFDGMSRFTTLNLEEFITFVEHYLDKQHEEYTSAFHSFDDDGSGSIDQAELTHLLASLDIVPMKWVVHEILDEVARDHDMLDLEEFELTLKVLKQREGFSKFEYERIMAAFRLYDHDGSGTLDTRECIGLFGYLYYSLSPDAVRELVHDVDFDGSGQLNEREFLMCMRKAREHEVERIQSAINYLLGQRRRARSWEVNKEEEEHHVKQPHEDEEQAHPEICRTETWAKLRLEDFSAADLSDFLRYFGIVAERDAVLEAIRDAGLELPMQEFGLDEAWRFLEVFRSREGFTRAEATDIEEAFRQHVPKQLKDSRVVQELDRLAVGKALKWLGHEASFELQQLLITEVDIDSKGLLGLPEFKKLIRKYRERELEEIKRALLTIGLYASHQEDDSNRNQQLVATEDYLAAITWLGMAAAFRDGSTAKMDVEELEGGIMKQDGSLHQALEERREVRQSYRHHAGFSPSQVSQLRSKFNEFDTGKCGEVSKQQLRNLFEDLFPEDEMHSRQSRSAIVMLLREVDDNGDGALDFVEFLHLMSQANERHVKQKLTREQMVVEQSGFTPMEVKEFREIFLTHDTRNTDYILFKDIKAIMSRVVPMGDKFKSQLKDLCHEVLELRGDSMEFDFPAFLQLMRRVLDIDFGEMKAKTEVMKTLTSPPMVGRRMSGMTVTASPSKQEAVQCMSRLASVES